VCLLPLPTGPDHSPRLANVTTSGAVLNRFLKSSTEIEDICASLLTNRAASSCDHSIHRGSHSRGLGFDPHGSTRKTNRRVEMRGGFVFGMRSAPFRGGTATHPKARNLGAASRASL